MTYTFEDIADARRQRERQFEQQVIQKFGALLAYDYADRADVKGRPGYVWYRDRGQSGGAAQALNLSVVAAPGLPVILQRMQLEKTWEVVRVDGHAITALASYTGSKFTDHAREHEPGGTDPLYVYLRMMVPLRTSPLSGLNVRINPFSYRSQGQLSTFKGKQSYDLSAYLPAAGLARYVLVSLDVATNALQVTSGGTSVDSAAINPAFPDPPSRCYPSAYIRLAGGQTEISEEDIVDARLLLGGTETVVDLIAGTAGQVLFSDGTDWLARTPLTEGGRWLADNGVMLIVDEP